MSTLRLLKKVGASDVTLAPTWNKRPKSILGKMLRLRKEGVPVGETPASSPCSISINPPAGSLPFAAGKGGAPEKRDRRQLVSFL